MNNDVKFHAKTICLLKLKIQLLIKLCGKYLYI